MERNIDHTSKIHHTHRNYMKTIIIPALLLGSAMLAGCKKETTEMRSEPLNSSEVNMKARVKVGTNETALSLRTDYYKSTDSTLSALDRKIDELKVKADSAAGDLKAEYQKAVEALRKKRTELNPKLEDLKNATSDAWENTKAGFDKAVKELDSAYESAKARISGK